MVTFKGTFNRALPVKQALPWQVNLKIFYTIEAFSYAK
jgi:hypothetical protein